MFRTGIPILSLVVLASTPAAGMDLRISAFCDVTFGVISENHADNAMALLYDDFGVSTTPLNEMDGFGIVGTDFVLSSDVSDELTYLAEINLQTERGESSEIEIDPERFFLNYRISELFEIQTGLYFTPMGYHNRFQYSRAWMMNSIQVPDLFEEDLNLVPTHTIGVCFHGKVRSESGHALNYSLSLGNGRDTTPNSAVYARDSAGGTEIVGLLEWTIPGYRDFRIAISGWTDKIETFKLDDVGDVSAADTETIELREYGIDPYMTFKSHLFDFFVEYVWARQADQLGNLDQESTEFNGIFVEAALNLHGRRLHPFVRYDRTSLPDGGGPYYPLREDGDGNIVRLVVPDDEAILMGAAYDLTVHSRLKAEYAHRLEGVRARHSFALQLALGF